MNDYDKRQLTLILKKIGFFRESDHSLTELSSLTNDIPALINVMEAIEEPWKEECRSWWWDLEEIYAVALDRDKSALDENDKQIVFKAVDEIENMVKKKMMKS